MILIIIVSTIFLMSGCLFQTAGTSTGTETNSLSGNTESKGVIAGRVVDTRGVGVAQARVRVVSVDHNPGLVGSGSDVADSVVTKSDGSFRTDSLPDGHYNLLGNKGENFSFRDSVPVSGEMETKLAGGDTLKPAGSVAGVVRLQPFHDSRMVLIILFGTTALNIPEDSIGNFYLANLAEGEYRLRILSTLDAYRPLDTLIRVQSGVQTILQDTLRLTYLPQPAGIPLINDLSLAYDSAKMAVTLTWAKRYPAQVGAYNVYRKHKDSAFVRLNKVPVADTVYRDDWRTGLLPGNVYHYSVTALDHRDNEGPKGEPAVLRAKAAYTVDSIRPVSECGANACHYDVGPDGSIWIAEDTTVTRISPGGGVSKWFNRNYRGHFNPQIALDENGDIYIFNPSLDPWLGKFSEAGDSIWIIALPFANTNLGFTLHAARDTIMVFCPLAQVMIYVSQDGRILGQNTLPAYVPSPFRPGNDPSYHPAIGYYTIEHFPDSQVRIRFQDGEGRDISEWKPEWRGNLINLHRDEAGRWYIYWNNNVLDVFSPDKVLLGSILADGRGNLRTWNGKVYLQSYPEKVLRIMLQY